MSIGGSEEIRYDILVEMQSALNKIEEFQTRAQNTAETIKMLTTVINANSKAWGLSFAGAAQEWQKFANTLTGVSGQNLGGLVGGAQDYKQALDDAGRTTKVLGDTTEEQTGRMARAYNPVITAIRVIVAMIVFDMVNAVRNTFTEMIQYANDYYEALFKIQTAQQVLASTGMVATQKEMVGMADELRQSFGVFSDVEMKDAVANAELLTRTFGLTQDQVKGIVQTAAVLAIQNHDLANMNSYIEQITRTLTSGTGTRALEQLGLNLDANTVRAKALAMGMDLVNGKLSDQQQTLAVYSLMMDRTNQLLGGFENFQKTIPGEADRLTASWAHFIQDVGVLFAHAIARIKTDLADMLDSVSNSFSKLQGFFTQLAAIGASTTAIYEDLIKSGGVWGLITNELTGRINIEKDALSAYNTALQQIKAAQDAAANSGSNLGHVLADLSKVDLSSLVNSVVSMSEQMDKLARDYSQRVQEIVQQYADKVSDAGRKYRENEINAEAKFQESMRQLREKYLYDLEDALRNRDARQVLRLMEQLKMQTETTENNYKIEKRQQEQQYRDELLAAKRAENEQLAQARQNYANQQADLLQSWDDKLKIEAQKLADDLGMNSTGAEKIYELLNKYYGPQGKMEGLYDGSLQSLQGFSAEVIAQIAALVDDANNMLSSLSWGYSSGPGGKVTTHPATTKGRGGQGANGTYVNSQGTTQTAPQNLYDSSGYRIWGNGQSAGADFVVPPGYPNDSFPLMAESGEHVQITPALPRGRSGVTSSATTASDSGFGGTITLEMLLSPDLEARVVGNTLNETARVITKIGKSK